MTANRVTDSQGTVGGGANNRAGNEAGTVRDRTLATVGGGGNNTASGEICDRGRRDLQHRERRAATVGGGENNTARGLRRNRSAAGTSTPRVGLRASVGGGQSNRPPAQDAVSWRRRQ